MREFFGVACRKTMQSAVFLAGGELCEIFLSIDISSVIVFRIKRSCHAIVPFVFIVFCSTPSFRRSHAGERGISKKLKL